MRFFHYIVLLVLYIVLIPTLSLAEYSGEAIPSAEFFGNRVDVPSEFDREKNQFPLALEKNIEYSRGVQDSGEVLEPFRVTEKKKEIDNLIPEEKEKVSLASAITLDIVIPGGGHFYIGNYYQGLTFIALKLLGAYSIYYFYQDWEYSRSLYYASRRANESIDPDHELEFKDPEGGYKTVEEYRREYDKAVQRITFAIIATAAIYITSVIFVYFDVREINERAVPTFDLQYSCDKINGSIEGVISISYTLRM
jgi:hypothetical protein